MSVNEKLTDISNAIREHTSLTDALTLDKMAAAIPQVYVIGASHNEQIWNAKVYIGYAQGNGQDNMAFAVPFKPDKILVSNACAISTGSNSSTIAEKTLFMAGADLRSFSNYIGYVILTQTGSSTKHGRIAQSSAPTRYAYADGVLNVSLPDGYGAFFSKDGLYKIVAMKEDRADAELLAEEIALLPDGSSVTFWKARIDEAVTTEEWEALIATKPNCTFTLV